MDMTDYHPNPPIRRGRVAVAALAAAGFLASASAAPAQCPGDCGADFLAAPKAVERWSKAAAKAVESCAKKAEPACPAVCPLPDAQADPYFLSASCASLLVCEMNALAEDALGDAWDDTGACALGVADDCERTRMKNAGKLGAKKIKRRRTSKMHKYAKDLAKCVSKTDAKAVCGGDTLCPPVGAWLDGVLPVRLGKGGTQILPFTAAAAGEGAASLTISAEAADWAIAGEESVVVDYLVDGQAGGQLVVHNGAEATEYHAARRTE